jgi:hypothetical protein
METGSAKNETAACEAKLMDKLFLKHPRSIGETYIQHLSFALCCGVRLVSLGFCLILHGIIPRCHETTASSGMRKIADELDARSKMQSCSK